MTDLIRGSCRDGPHSALCVKILLISRRANGQTATISVTLEQKHEVICVDAADKLTVDGCCVPLPNVINFKYLHIYPFLIDLNDSNTSFRKTGKSLFFSFLFYFEDLCPKLGCLLLVLSLRYRCLECIAKPGLQGLAYSSLCRLCTGWRSRNPQTDLNSSRKALDPESTHFLQTSRPKREEIFGHGWNPWLKSAISEHTRAPRRHINNHGWRGALIQAHAPPRTSPESPHQVVERGSLSTY